MNIDDRSSEDGKDEDSTAPRRAKDGGGNDRQARQARALRENLRKRKAQSRARRTHHKPAATTGDDTAEEG